MKFKGELKMRTFEHFPEDSVCPICKTSNDGECCLISIDGTDEDGICEAIPVHTDCLTCFRYNKDAGLIYIRA